MEATEKKIVPVGSLDDYFAVVRDGRKHFENAAQSVTRMIMEGGHSKVPYLGKKVIDFNIFRNKTREGDDKPKKAKHIIGAYNELNSGVHFIKDSAEGGSSKDMAFVFVGEPGNGKTYFVDYLCRVYREFISRPENRKYTFKFINLRELGGYGRSKMDFAAKVAELFEALIGKEADETAHRILSQAKEDILKGIVGEAREYYGIEEAESQTFEDPMILLMNLFGSTKNDREKSKEYMESLGFSAHEIGRLFKNYRPLGACSEFMLNQVREKTDGDVAAMLSDFLRITKVPVSETRGIVTGKYSAKDKITSSSVDLVGEESLQRLLYITDSNNPYRFDLRRGALARVACGGIHFADEMFKNKPDLIKIYLHVIQNRNIEIDGFVWPIDALIIATSNNVELSEFRAERKEAPIIDRCRFCFMTHNTNYREQMELTRYALGEEQKTTLDGEKLHSDPNLEYVASVAMALTRLPRHRKLEPEEMLKLAAGEIAGDKSIDMLVEIINELEQDVDISKWFGQKGMGYRAQGRSLQGLKEMIETNEGKCTFAKDFFKACEKEILIQYEDTGERDKYRDDLKRARKLYRQRIRRAMYDAYMDDPRALENSVMNYINMIMGLESHHLNKQEKEWSFLDPQTKELRKIRVDTKFVEAVEGRMGLKTDEARNSHRSELIKLYAQKQLTDPSYNFMDNEKLKGAVADVVLETDIEGQGSLVGVLANQTNEKNKEMRSRIIKSMTDKLGYCETCAIKTIEYYCSKDDD